MSWGGIKRTPGDAAFSACVREANDYTCQKCGINLRHNPRAMHLSHFYGRRGKSTRWDKLNGFCMCAACHSWLGEHPHEHTNLVKDIIGSGAFDILAFKAHTPYKMAKGEDKEIAKHYKEQLKIIQKLRAEGKTGYIDFESYQ